jgi:hypothetical protein
MKQGAAYVVVDGAARFSTPPPAGWTVAFEMPPETKKTVCTVIYPDGTLREVDQDPWVLLMEARREREEARKTLAEAGLIQASLEKVVVSLADGARAEMSRLLGECLERADAAVSEAARLAAESTRGSVLAEIDDSKAAVLAEWRNWADDARKIRAELDEWTRAALDAGLQAGELVDAVKAAAEAAIRDQGRRVEKIIGEQIAALSDARTEGERRVTRAGTLAEEKLAARAEAAVENIEKAAARAALPRGDRIRGKKGGEGHGV